jgi:alanine racemase
LEGFFEADELSLISAQNFWSVIHSVEQVEMLEKYTLNQPINIWLKIDTGMHRLGISLKNFSEIYQRLTHCKGVNKITLMTHFSCSDELTNDFTTQQLAHFKRVSSSLCHDISLANSAAILNWPQTHGDWIRPGIMLYGSSPFSVDHPLASQLRPTMTFRSKVIAERMIKAGEFVGYANSWRCQSDTRVGTVAIGYADGYPRHAASGTPVMVDGKPSQLIGRVSMDMINIDLTSIPTTGVGSDVELWGKDILVDEVADAADTIAYELFTRLTNRPRRVYIKG